LVAAAARLRDCGGRSSTAQEAGDEIFIELAHQGVHRHTDRGDDGLNVQVDERSELVTVTAAKSVTAEFALAPDPR